MTRRIWYDTVVPVPHIAFRIVHSLGFVWKRCCRTVMWLEPVTYCVVCPCLSLAKIVGRVLLVMAIFLVYQEVAGFLVHRYYRSHILSNVVSTVLPLASQGTWPVGVKFLCVIFSCCVEPLFNWFASASLSAAVHEGTLPLVAEQDAVSSPIPEARQTLWGGTCLLSTCGVFWILRRRVGL